MITNFIQMHRAKSRSILQMLLLKLNTKITSSILVVLSMYSCSKTESVNHGGATFSKIFQDENDESTKRSGNHDEAEEEGRFANSHMSVASLSKSSVIKKEGQNLFWQPYLMKDSGLACYINDTMLEIMWFYVTPDDLDKALDKQVVTNLLKSKPKVNVECLQEILKFCLNSLKEKIKNKDQGAYDSFGKTIVVMSNSQSSFHCKGCDVDLKAERLSFINISDCFWYCEDCRTSYIPEKQQNSTLLSNTRNIQGEKSTTLSKVNYRTMGTQYIEVPMACMLNLLEIGKAKCLSDNLKYLNYLAFCIKNLSKLFSESLKELESSIDKAKGNKEEPIEKLKSYYVSLKGKKYEDIIELHLKRICIYNTIMWIQEDYDDQYSRNTLDSLKYLVPIEGISFMLEINGENLFDLLFQLQPMPATEENNMNDDEAEKCGTIQLKKCLLLFSLLNELPTDSKKEIIKKINESDSAWVFEIESLCKSCIDNKIMDLDSIKCIRVILGFIDFIFEDEKSYELSKNYDILKLKLLFKGFEGDIRKIHSFINEFKNIVEMKPKPSEFEQLLKAYINCDNEEIKKVTAKNIEDHTLLQIVMMLSFKHPDHLNWAIKNKLLLDRTPEEVGFFIKLAPILGENGLFTRLSTLEKSELNNEIRASINGNGIGTPGNRRNIEYTDFYAEELIKQKILEKKLEEDRQHERPFMLNQLTTAKKNQEFTGSKRVAILDRQSQGELSDSSSEKKKKEKIGDIDVNKSSGEISRQRQKSGGRNSFRQTLNVKPKDLSASIKAGDGSLLSKYSKGEKGNIKESVLYEFMWNSIKSGRNSFRNNRNVKPYEQGSIHEPTSAKFYLQMSHEFREGDLKEKARDSRNSFNRRSNPPNKDKSINLSEILNKIEDKD